MLLKLVFFDKTKYNQTWINRLFDRVSKLKDRQWKVSGGSPYGSPSVEFDFKLDNGTRIEEMAPIDAQRLFNEIVWCFVLEQINVEKFFVDGTDLTQQLTHR